MKDHSQLTFTFVMTMCYFFYPILVIPKVRICDGESTVSVMEGDSMTLHCYYDTNVTPVQSMWQQNVFLFFVVLLPVTLDSPFLIASSVFSNVYLHSS
jgi:hypothetical protein